MTENSKVVRLRQPDDLDDPLTAILRSGARQRLAQAIEAEVESFLATLKDVKLADGRDRVVRHGHGPERTIQTGIGPVAVRRAKLRDRGSEGAGERIRFTSAILRRSCRAGRGAPRAWTLCSPSSTCAASPPETSRRRWPPCWARRRQTCRRRSSVG